jgi:hypothetical protein
MQETDVAGGQLFGDLESVSEKLLLRQRAGAFVDLEQCLHPPFEPVAPRDVEDNGAERRWPVVLPDNEACRLIDSSSVGQLRDFGLAGSEDAPIESVERLAKFAGKQLAVATAEDPGVVPLQCRLQTAVGEDDAPLLILDRSQAGQVIEEPLQQATHAAGILLGVLARVDVLDNRNEVLWRPLVIANQRDTEVDPEATAVLADVALFQRVAVDFPAQRPLELGQVARQVIRVSDVLEAHGEQFRLRVADQLAQALVDPQPAPVARNEGNTDRRLVDGSLQIRFAGAQPLLALAQRILVVLLDGDIADNAGDRLLDAVRRGDQMGDTSQPAQLAVATPDDPVFERGTIDLTARDAAKSEIERLAVVRVHQRQPAWPGVRVVDVGSGNGVQGIADREALAGKVVGKKRQAANPLRLADPLVTFEQTRRHRRLLLPAAHEQPAEKRRQQGKHGHRHPTGDDFPPPIDERDRGRPSDEHGEAIGRISRVRDELLAAVVALDDGSAHGQPGQGRAQCAAGQRGSGLCPSRQGGSRRDPAQLRIEQPDVARRFGKEPGKHALEVVDGNRRHGDAAERLLPCPQSPRHRHHGLAGDAPGPRWRDRQPKLRIVTQANEILAIRDIDPARGTGLRCVDDPAVGVTDHDEAQRRMAFADALQPAFKLLPAMRQLPGILVGDSAQAEVDSAVLALDILADQPNDGRRFGTELLLRAAPRVGEDERHCDRDENIDPQQADAEVADETRLRQPATQPPPGIWSGTRCRGGRTRLAHGSAVASRSGHSRRRNRAPPGTMA